MFSVYKKRVMGKYDIYTGCSKRIAPATRKQMTPYLLPASYSCANFEYRIFNVWFNNKPWTLNSKIEIVDLLIKF